MGSETPPPTPDQPHGQVNPLGGKVHHPVSDDDRKRWAGFVAYVRVCPECARSNDEHNLFCTNCAADLRETAITPSSDPQPGVSLLQRRMKRDQRLAARMRLGETHGGGGWIAIAIATIVGTIIVNPDRMLAVPIWIAAVSMAVIGIWQLRRDTGSLRAWGGVLVSCAVLLLALVGFQAIRASGLVQDDTMPEAPPLAPTATTAPVLASSPVTTGLDGSVPMYQGNAAHDGVMPGPAPLETPRLVWQAETGGELYAAPSLGNGMLFVSSKSGSLMAFHAATGDMAWSSEVSTYVMRGTPAIADGVVYAGGGFDFRAVDAVTGGVLWHVPIQYGGQASPTIAGDHILVTSQQGWLYSLNRSNGETAWRIPTEGLAFGSVAVSDGNVVFGTDEGIIYNAKLETGRLNWRTQVAGSVFATPVISGSQIFITTASGEVYALDLATGKTNWRASHGSTEPPAVLGDLVVVAASNGGIYGLDAATGEQRWLHPGGREAPTAPVIVDGLVLIGSGTTLYAIDATTGKTAWYFLAGDVIESSPVVVANHVFFGARDGFLYAVATA